MHEPPTFIHNFSQPTGMTLFEVPLSSNARLIPMDSSRRSHTRTTTLLFQSAAVAAILATFGCASPGPPPAPTHNQPEPVRDLSVIRIGNTVELHFTAPARTTDKLPIRGGTVTGQLCRQLEHQSCQPVPSSKIAIETVGPNGTRNQAAWVDTLPEALTQGAPRLLAYRMEFFSPSGRSAGPSAPAFSIAGLAPATVRDLHAEGSRLGVLLQWDTSSQLADVVLEREDLAPTQPKPHKSKAISTSAVWLGTHGPNDNDVQPNRTLDTTALPDVPYRYTAERRVTLQLEGHSIELRSALSGPVTFTLHEAYPPPAPTGLNAVGFFTSAPTNGSTASFAVDLIWQPVDDAGLLAGLAGYNVYREPLNSTGNPTANRTRLTPTPTPTPAFHDTTASQSTPYRYSVTAIDAKGNESPAVTVLLQPSAAP
jgi:hypothetical protein